MLVELDVSFFVGFAMPVIALALGLSIAANRQRGGDPAIRWLISSNLCFLSAAAALFLRPLIPFEMSATLVLGGAFFGIVTGYLAVRDAAGAKNRSRLLLGLGLGAILAETLIAIATGSLVPLFVSSSLINGPGALLMAVSVWRLTRPHGFHAAALLTLPFVVIGLAYLVRLAAVLMSPDDAVYRFATAVIVVLLASASIKLIFGIGTLRAAQLNARLADMHRRAEVASEAKSSFLRTMSHELRTPLNAILGFSDMMRAQTIGPLPERYLGYAGHIHTSGTYLLDLITDILDLSAIEAGALPIHEDAFAPGSVLIAALDLLQPRADLRGVSLHRSDEATLAALPLIQGDARRLQQVLANLVSNAVKYTPSGGRVDIDCAQTVHGGLEFRIADTGPGMTDAEIATAMQLFGRVHATVNRSIEGTGIGLPLSRELVEAHGGKLWLESRPGEGTVAIVTLPGWRVLPREPLAAAS